jgi:WD40 repeat protein
MHVIVTCTQCSRQLRLPQEVLGSTVSCPLCKAIFVVRETAGGKIETIPVTGPSKESTSSKPSGKAPNLSLEDEVPLVPLASDADAADVPLARLADDEPEQPRPLRLADDEPLDVIPVGPRRDRERDRDRTRRRDDDDRDRPRRRDDDEEDDDHEERPRQRKRRSGPTFPAISFSILIDDDPRGRLNGRFQAEVVPDGLRFWRGRGRILYVDHGENVEYLGGARLAVPIDGRRVELTVVQNDGHSRYLAQALADFFKGERDTIALPGKKAGPVVLVALLPLLMPVGAILFGYHMSGFVGGLIWGLFGLLLAGLCALIVFRSSWSVKSRIGGAGAAVLLGYMILGCGLLIDRASGQGVSDRAWESFTPKEGGFTILMPGSPRPGVMTEGSLRGGGMRTWDVPVVQADLLFRAGMGEFAPERLRGLPTPNSRLDAARTILTVNHPASFVANEMTVRIGVPETMSKEYQLRAGEQSIMCRVVVRKRRVYILSVSGDSSVDRNRAEVRKFFESFRPDFNGELPDIIGAPAGVPPPVQVPRPGVPPPSDDLGPNGRLILRESVSAWASFTPNSQSIIGVMGSNRVYNWDANGMQRWNVTLPGKVSPSCAAVSADNRLLAVGSQRGDVRIIDLTTRRISGLNVGAPPGTALLSVAFSPDGKTLALAHADRRVRLWDVARRRVRDRIDAVKAEALVLTFSGDGKLLAVADATRTIRVYDATTRKSVATCTGHQQAVGPRIGPQTAQWSIRALAFARDNRTLASAGSDGTARVWDATTGVVKRVLQVGASVTAVAFHPPGRLLATGTSDGKVDVWDVASGAKRGSIRQRFGAPVQAGLVRSLSFSSDGRALVASVENRIERWNVEGQISFWPQDRTPLVSLPRNLTRLEVGEGRGIDVRSLAVSKDGTRFAVALSGAWTGIRVHAVAGLKKEVEIAASTAGPVALASDRPVLAFVTTFPPRINVHDSRSGRSLAPLAATGSLQGLALSADGLTLASGHAQGINRTEVRLWDGTAKSMTRSFRTNLRGGHALALSPDGLSVAVASQVDPIIRLHEAATGREYAGLKGHTAGVDMLAYSADSKLLASAGRDNSVRLWNTTRCRQAFHLTGHTRPVSAVAFSPDGKTLATGSSDQTVKLWDTDSGKLLLSLNHDGPVVGVGFAVAGNTLIAAVSGRDANVSLWDLREVMELKKRPPAIEPNLDRSPAPEVPEVQLAGMIEPHLARVVDPKGGYLLAFTRDRLCLRYSYPELKLRGSYWTGSLIYHAALDPEKGVVYAAVADLRSLKPPAPLTPAWEGQGPIHVYDVKTVVAGKEASGKLKPTAVVPINGKLTGLYLGGEGRWLCYHDMKDFLKPAIGRIDTATNKPDEPLVLPDRPTLLRMAPDGKTLYAAGLQPRERTSYVQPINVEAFKAGNRVTTEVHALQMSVSGDHVVITGSERTNRQGIYFLDRKKDDLPMTIRWPGVAGLPVVRVVGDRVFAVSRFGGARLDVYPLDAKVTGRVPPVKAQLESQEDQPLDSNFRVMSDGKHLLFDTGVMLRVAATEVNLPQAAEAEGQAEEGPGVKQSPLRQLSLWKRGHSLRVLALAWSPDGRKVLSGGADRRLLIRQAADGKVERSRWVGGPVHAAAWSRDNKLWAAATWAGTTALGHASNHFIGQNKARGLAAGVDTIAFSPDGTMVAGAADRGLILWHCVPGQADLIIATPEPLTGVAIASGSGLVAAGGMDGLVRLFELSGDKEKAALKGHEGEVRCVATSPDGKTVVSGGVDGLVKVWDVEGNKVRHTLEAKTAAVVLSVAVATDGKLIASGSLDGTVRLWDASTGQTVAEVPGKATAPIYALAFAADGKTLAVAAGQEVRRLDTTKLVGPAPGNR